MQTETQLDEIFISPTNPRKHHDQEKLKEFRPPKGASWSARTVDEIAARLSKSRSWIYSRLKLLELTKENRKRFYDDQFDASRALLLARIPNDELQNKAGEEIADSEDRGSWSYRDAHQHVVRNYMLRLADAPFPTGDAQLVAKAGACSTCPKRTGNQAELFADVDNADICTDPECFKQKKLAQADKQIEEAKAKGRQVLPAGEVKKAFENYSGRYTPKYYGSDYKPADAKTPDDKVILAKTPDGEVHKLVKAAKPKPSKSSSTRSTPAAAKPSGPAKPDPAELARVRGEARAMDEFVRKFAADPSPALWRLVAVELASTDLVHWCSPALNRRLRGADKLDGASHQLAGGPDKIVASLAKKMKTAGELQALVVDLILDQAVEDGGIESIAPLLKLAGVDLKAHMKKAADEIAAAAVPGPKKKPEAKKKGARG